MQSFTKSRTIDTPDEIWWTEHHPVYTQGRAGKPEHILSSSPGIPIVQTDRGGQVTYHGPGQLVVYPLLNLKRYGLGVRQLVELIEQCIIDLLSSYEVLAVSRADAPGVYVMQRKIASLGLRISRGYSFHGLALNVINDLTPFKHLNPCGYAGLEMTSMGQELAFPALDLSEIAGRLIRIINTRLEDLPL